MTKEFCVLFCTTSVDESDRIARVLIEEKLAACVNITEVNSYYRWEGEFCEDKEALLIIKTEKSRVDEIIERIKELHSYELPEIIALPIVAGYDKYLEWVDESVG
ncbi:MAG TPA: divalent-cation tolerance protein CutA [Candidatus Bathyarchaeia archaeon]|nr:divalent-cation tolerance protein CutA [Candidatus Bathyarchaeia archaeon]